MRVGWVVRRMAVASVAVASAVGVVGVGAAQASPVARDTSTLVASRSVPATSCSGKKVILTSWKSGKSSYKPDAKVRVRGDLENCTKGTVGVTLKASIQAPCGHQTLSPSKGRLTAKEKRVIGVNIASLPGSNDGHSCAGTWKVKVTVTSAGKTLTTKTASFKES